MEDEYDVIILGTGLKECILSGVLSCEGKKVLHMDRNSYYGGDSASLTLDQLFKKFNKGEVPASLGQSRDYNVDLVPKFVMSCGKLVEILVKTDVTRYLDFKSVDGSYCVHNGKPHKVPATAAEAFKSSLMGMLEKRRCGKFMEYIGNYDDKDPKTHKGHNIDKMTSRELYKEFGLKPDTIDFVGHAMGLYPTEDYLDRPCREMMDKVRLYGESVMRYGNSPYIYPLYGLGEMPQGFARLSAIYGGTYMLNKPVEEIVYEAGKVVGVKSEGETAKCKLVVGDPSYFPDKVKKTGQVVRCMCILSHPVANTDNAESGQIVIPQREAKRGHDVYVSFVSFAHNVAPAGKYIAMVSTTVETANPESEVEAGLKLLGAIDEKFFDIQDTFAPVADGKEDQVFITTSFDAESHFEPECLDILDVYKRITGKDMDLTPPNKDANDS